MDPNLNLSRYISFSVARKKFNNVVSQKMGDNFEDEDNSGLITKKFWSYVKTTANSTRIPEIGLMYFENTFKSNTLDQSELFIRFFTISFPKLVHLSLLLIIITPTIFLSSLTNLEYMIY